MEHLALIGDAPAATTVARGREWHGKNAQFHMECMRCMRCTNSNLMEVRAGVATTDRKKHTHSTE